MTRRQSLPRRPLVLTLAGSLALAPTSSLAQTPAAPAATVAAPGAVPAWVTKSNELAQVWLEAQAKLSPESAGQSGLDGYDEGITDLAPGYQDRARAVV